MWESSPIPPLYILHFEFQLVNLEGAEYPTTLIRKVGVARWRKLPLTSVPNLPCLRRWTPRSIISEGSHNPPSFFLSTGQDNGKYIPSHSSDSSLTPNASPSSHPSHSNQPSHLNAHSGRNTEFYTKSGTTQYPMIYPRRPGFPPQPFNSSKSHATRMARGYPRWLTGSSPRQPATMSLGIAMKERAR